MVREMKKDCTIYLPDFVIHAALVLSTMLTCTASSLHKLQLVKLRTKLP